MSKNMNGNDLCGIKNLHDIEVLKEQIHRHLLSFQGRDPKLVGNLDIFKALAYTLRDLLIRNWIKNQRINYTKKKKRIYLDDEKQHYLLNKLLELERRINKQEIRCGVRSCYRQYYHKSL